MAGRMTVGGARRRLLLGGLAALALAGPAAPVLAEDVRASVSRPAAPGSAWNSESAEVASAKAHPASTPGRHKYARYDESDLQRARRALGSLQRADPGLTRLFESAAGYAVFAEVGTSSGGDGVGVLFEDGQAAGRATLPRSPASMRPDGQPYAAVVLFGTRQAVASFKQGGLAVTAQARAAAVVAGATSKVRYVDGVSVLTFGRDGGVTGPEQVTQGFAYLPYHREITISSR